MGYLNVDGVTHLWSKVKGLSDLKIKKTDVMTNEEIDRMFETSTPVVPPVTLVTPVVELYQDGHLHYLRIANIQEGYEYYYTLNLNDGSIPDAPADPTKESTLYTGPISIGASRGYYSYYIKVVAYVGSKSSIIVEIKGQGSNRGPTGGATG